MFGLKNLALIGLLTVTSVSAFAGGGGGAFGSKETQRKEACLRRQEVVFSKIVQQNEPIVSGQKTVTDLVIRFSVTRDLCGELNLRANFLRSNGEIPHSGHGSDDPMIGYVLAGLEAKTEFFNAQGQPILKDSSDLMTSIFHMNFSIDHPVGSKVAPGEIAGMRIRFRHFEPFVVAFRSLRK